MFQLKKFEKVPDGKGENPSGTAESPAGYVVGRMGDDFAVELAESDPACPNGPGGDPVAFDDIDAIPTPAEDDHRMRRVVPSMGPVAVQMPD